MGNKLTLNINNLIDIKPDKLIGLYQDKVNKIYNDIEEKRAVGSDDWMGWRMLPINYDQKLLTKMQEQVSKWNKLGITKLVVIGIGGSYLGAKAAIDMCYKSIKNVTIEWVHNISSDYIDGLCHKLAKQKFGIVVISKSGTTLEPAIGFKIFKDLLAKFVGPSNVNKYIVAITDANKGTLLQQAKHSDWCTLPIPDDIGGRFSMLTPVGMFIMMYAGLNWKQMLLGAKDAYKDTISSNLEINSAARYAAIRHYLYTNKKYAFENVNFYDPHLLALGEQWKQMFCESEGKDKKGLFETCSLFTTDLHSLGQYFQDGTRNFYELTVLVTKPNKEIKLNFKNDEHFEYLNNKTLDFVNKAAFNGTIAAHTNEGKVNNIVIEIEHSDEYNYGYLSMWLSMVVTIDAYLLGVNPFNQPGVEAYKKGMMSNLKK